MKLWFLAFGIVAAAAWILVTPMRGRVLPEVLRNGNEQILAQWRDAMLAYKAELGYFPPVDIRPTRDESIVNGLNKENTAGPDKKGKVFIDLTSVRLDNISPVDAWGNNLIFDPDHTGDLSHVLSAGPDGLVGTEDDMSSLKARQRNIPVPPEILEERLGKRAVNQPDTDASKPAAADGAGKEASENDPASGAGKPATPQPAP